MRHQTVQRVDCLFSEGRTRPERANRRDNREWVFPNSLNSFLVKFVGKGTAVTKVSLQVVGTFDVPIAGRQHASLQFL